MSKLWLILLIIFSLNLQAQVQCRDLFKTEAVILKPIELEQIFGQTIFLGPAFHEIFKRHQLEPVNYALAGKRVQQALDQLTPTKKEEVRKSLLRSLDEAPDYYNNETKTQFGMLRIALQENAGRHWINQTLQMDRFTTDVTMTAQFVSGLQSSTKQDMVKWAIYFYSSAQKHYKGYYSDIEKASRLPPKRALLLFLKVAMGWEKELMAYADFGSLKASQYLKYLQSIKGLISEHGSFINEVPSESVIAGLKEIQKQLIKQMNNADILKEDRKNISIIVDGSFPNGLAFTHKSDIDLVILDQALREEFAIRENSIKLSIYDSMQEKGYDGLPLPLQNIVHMAPQFFTSADQAVEFGHLGALSFRIYADRIEVIVFNTTQRNVLKSNYRILDFAIDE